MVWPRSPERCFATRTALRADKIPKREREEKAMKLVRYFTVCVFCVVLAVVAAMMVTAQSDDPSGKSSPPDMTAYVRNAIPDDHTPNILAPASPSVFQAPTVVDVVVNNTDPTLTMTDTFNDGEPSIAVNPLNPNEIVITAFSGSWGANAPVWHSMDGGNTWTKRFTVPAPPGIPSAVGCPCD